MTKEKLEKGWSLVGEIEVLESNIRHIEQTVVLKGQCGGLNEEMKELDLSIRQQIVATIKKVLDKKKVAFSKL